MTDLSPLPAETPYHSPYAAMVLSLPVPAWTVDRNGGIRCANPLAADSLRPEWIAQAVPALQPDCTVTLHPAEGVTWRLAPVPGGDEWLVTVPVALPPDPERLSFDALPALVAYIGPDERYRWVNARYAEWFGIPAEQFVDRSLGELVGAWSEARLRPLRQALAGETARFIGEMISPDGEGRVSEVTYTPDVRDGQVRGVVAMAVDVTRREEAIQALQVSEAQIADGVRRQVQSDERLRLALSAANAGTWLYDAETRSGKWSPECYALYGVASDRGELDLELLLGLVVPEDRDSVVQALRSSLAHQREFRHEYRIRHEMLGERWLVSAGGPVPGEGHLLSGITYDVTDARRQVATLEATLRMGETFASEHEPERIVQALLDASTRAVGAQFGAFFYNITGETGADFGLYLLSGAPREAFSGFPPVRATPIFAPTFAEGLIVRSDDVPTDPRYGRMGDFHGMPTGHLPVRSYLAVPVRGRDEGVLGALLFGHSEPGRFSEHHEALVEAFSKQAAVAYENAVLYAQLRTAKEELEKRVRERTQQLEEAYREAESFSYTASHDLRAPLRAITSTSQILMEDYGDDLPEDARFLLNRQQAAGKRLATLVDDLLRYSKIGRGEVKREGLDLTAIARDLAQELGDRNRKAQIEVAEGLQADGDPSLVRLVLQNLLENALTYSPEGGVVQVGQEDEAFFVRDQGIGFDPRQAEAIFQPFHRLHREEFPGTGIGLANVQKIVVRHGGRVWAESEPGQGSTFRFTL